jgi:hypothetical protein
MNAAFLSLRGPERRGNLDRSAQLARDCFTLVAMPGGSQFLTCRLDCSSFAIGMVGVVLATDKPGLFLAGWRHGASYAVFFLALTGTCCWRSTAAFA